MRHLLPHLWPSACLLIAVASCGCQNSRQCCCPCNAQPVAKRCTSAGACSCSANCRQCCCKGNAPAATMASAPIVAQYPSASVASFPVKHVTTYPPLPPVVSTTSKPTVVSSTKEPQRLTPAPVSDAASWWAQPEHPAVAGPTQISAAARAWSQVQQPEIVVASKTKPAPVNTTVSLKVPMQSSATIPEGQRFGHDANYHQLVGTLDYSKIQDSWVLRYVSYEEDDRYGGCVTLVGPGNGNSLKAGQTVRVEGTLIDPDSHQLRPAFQVRRIRIEGS